MEDDSNKSEGSKIKGLSCRDILNTLVFLGFMINYMLRVNLTFAIVDMVLPNSTNHGNIENVTDCYNSSSKIPLTTTTLDPYDEELIPEGGYDDPPNVTDVRSDVVRFSWTESQQGYLIGSFFWGYICTELPGGRLSEIIGARRVFGYATLGASAVTLLTPVSAKYNFIAVIVMRVILGFFLGVTWPSIIPMATKWIPPNERGKFMSNMMGSTLGAAFTLPMCGYIIALSSWEYVFYITGMIGVIWSAVWFMLIYDSPATHPKISIEERRYIESQIRMDKYKELLRGEKESGREEESLPKKRGSITKECDGMYHRCNTDPLEMKRQVSNRDGHDDIVVEVSNAGGEGGTRKNEKTRGVDLTVSMKDDNTSETSVSSSEQQGHGNAPWLHILTSVPVWAFVATHTASVFGYNTITSQLPTYMNRILCYKIKENGILSAFPYLGKYIVAISAGVFADKLAKSSKYSKNGIKKFFTAIAVMVPGFLMMLQVFMGRDRVFSIFIFTATLTINGMVTGGYLSNSLDLAPNYSGTIFGLANMCSSAGGAISALLVGYLTEGMQIYSQWQKVFWIVGWIYVIGALTFLIFGTTKTQPWNINEPVPAANVKSVSPPPRRIIEERMTCL